MEWNFLNSKVAQMTAAKRHKDEINRSKRRINQISGQPGSFYVSEARKAVKGREDKDAAKKARSEELKRKREVLPVSVVDFNFSA